MKKDKVLGILRAHQQEIESLGIISLELFGSVARDEASWNSDVDLLADFLRPFGLIQFSKAQYYLEQILDCPVDLGTKSMLKESISNQVLQESIHVF
jgi:uncharacterized protein